MPYNAQYDLRGKQIEDTFQQVLQYNTSSNLAFDGLGNQTNVTTFSSSFATSASWAPPIPSDFAVSASWSSQSFWATSASFASRSISASYAQTSSVVNTVYAVQVLPDVNGNFGIDKAFDLAQDNFNVAMGFNAMFEPNFNNLPRNNNIAIGLDALAACSNGNNNIGIGVNAGDILTGNTTGNNNISVGSLAGSNIFNPLATANVSNSFNIMIDNTGSASDDHVIRIGNSQTDTFLVGVVHGNGGGLFNISSSISSSYAVSSSYTNISGLPYRAGQQAIGNLSTSQIIIFSSALPTSSYSVGITPDSTLSSSVSFAVIGKTIGGFTASLSAGIAGGVTVDYIAFLNN